MNEIIQAICSGLIVGALLLIACIACAWQEAKLNKTSIREELFKNEEDDKEI